MFGEFLWLGVLSSNMGQDSHFFMLGSFSMVSNISQKYKTVPFVHLQHSILNNQVYFYDGLIKEVWFNSKDLISSF